MNTVLFIFSGLPSSGKSTLARLLAEKIKGSYLRIDTIEQALRDLCSCDVQGEGYRLAYRIAADNLKCSTPVVADSCNPWNLTRAEWEGVALKNSADFINIEVICSDPLEHKTRAERRMNEITGLTLPTWEEIQNIEYHRWPKERIVIDTAGRTAEESFEELIQKVKATLRADSAPPVKIVKAAPFWRIPKMLKRNRSWNRNWPF